MFAKRGNMDDLKDFLEPLDVEILNEDAGFTDGQLGQHIKIFTGEIPDLDGIDLVIIGSGETRGSCRAIGVVNAANQIRKQFYRLHYWHDQIKIADLGNIKPGATLSDTYAAISTVTAELNAHGITVIFLGGSHDLMLGMYNSFKSNKKQIETTCIDAKIDLQGNSPFREENFLLEMLTGEPNFIRHYNHIGFQSYFVHPRMLETMDKLRFDCFRVGVVREHIEEMEPVLRNTNLLGFDISAIRNSDAPSNQLTPNGLTGEEACTLMQFAGLSPNLSGVGIYGYYSFDDHHELSAVQIAQMLWYFMDGRNKRLQESPLTERHNFNEYHTLFAEVDTLFLQSKRTQRWWMQLPDNKFISCSYNDYLNASRNQIPERWLRTQERDA